MSSRWRGLRIWISRLNNESSSPTRQYTAPLVSIGQFSSVRCNGTSQLHGESSCRHPVGLQSALSAALRQSSTRVERSFVDGGLLSKDRTWSRHAEQLGIRHDNKGFVDCEPSDQRDPFQPQTLLNQSSQTWLPPVKKSQRSEDSPRKLQSKLWQSEMHNGCGLQFSSSRMHTGRSNSHVFQTRHFYGTSAPAFWASPAAQPMEIPQSADQIRLVFPDGNHKICTMNQAAKVSKKQGTDLILVSASAKPPVYKLGQAEDAEAAKKQKEMAQRRKARESKRASQVKEFRIGVKAAEYDVDRQLKAAEQFLSKGHKVKITFAFKRIEEKFLPQQKALILEKCKSFAELGDQSNLGKSASGRTSILLAPLKPSA